MQVENFIFPMIHWKFVLLIQRTTGWLCALHLHPTHAVAVSVQRHRPVPWRGRISALSWCKNAFTVHYQTPSHHHFNTPARAATLPPAAQSLCTMMGNSSRETHTNASQITSRPKRLWLDNVLHPATFQHQRRKNKWGYCWGLTQSGGRGWNTILTVITKGCNRLGGVCRCLRTPSPADSQAQQAHIPRCCRCINHTESAMKLACSLLGGQMGEGPAGFSFVPCVPSTFPPPLPPAGSLWGWCRLQHWQNSSTLHAKGSSEVAQAPPLSPHAQAQTQQHLVGLVKGVSAHGRAWN